jgi:hypothetical protein
MNNRTPWAELEKRKAEDSEDNGNNTLNCYKEKMQENRMAECRNIKRK